MKHRGLLLVGGIFLLFCWKVTHVPPNKWMSIPISGQPPGPGPVQPERNTLKPPSAPDWRIGFGEEFWKQRNTAGGVDIGAGIQRVRHAFSVQAGQGSIRAAQFQAEVSNETITFLPSAGTKSAARIRTVGVHAGCEELTASEPGEWAFKGNTAQRLLYTDPQVVEHLETGPEGLEISWVFPQAPATDGDLKITMALEGLDYLGETPRGHHFADENGTARVRVGEILAVDSGGRRWALEMTREENLLAIHVPRDVLAASTYPLAIDPVISPEFGMDKPVPAAASASQQLPQVASNGQVHFVVWHEDRGEGLLFHNDIRGALLSQGGDLLTPEGILVAGGPAYQHTPVVAANGNGFLVVWSDSVIFKATRVNASGKVLDDPVINLELTGSQPGLVAHSEGFIFCWNTGGRVECRLLGLDGRPSPAHGYSVAGLNPAIGWNGRVGLLAWQSQGGLFGIPINKQGQALEAAPFQIAQSGPVLRVASDGTDFLLVWEERVVFSGVSLHAKVFGTRVSEQGRVLDAPPLLILEHFDSPAVTFDGTHYLVVARQTSGTISPDSRTWTIVMSRIARDGQPAGAPIPVFVAESQFLQSPQISVLGGVPLVVWEQEFEGFDIMAEAVPGPDVRPPVLLSRGDNQTRASAVAANQEGYLVVWQDNRLNFTDTANDIYGARFDLQGRLLDPNGIGICTHRAHQSSPAVASNGPDFLVAWRDGRNTSDDIYGARVSSGGAVLDASGLEISREDSTQRAPAVTSSKTQYFVVWRDDRVTDPPTNDNIVGARVGFDGLVRDPNGMFITQAPAAQEAPAVASNGDSFLAVWRDYRNNPAVSDIYGAIVGADGSVATPDGIPIAVGGEDDRAPEVASHGAGYAVVWRNSAGIYVRRVEATGELALPGPLPVASGRRVREPSITFDGRRYQMAWLREEGGSLACCVEIAAMSPSSGEVRPLGIQLRSVAYDPDVLSIAAARPDSLITLTQRYGIPPRTAGNLVWWGPVIQRVETLAEGVRITWQSEPGKLYQVQHTTAPGQIPWADLGPALSSGGRESTYTHTNAREPAGFYRIVELP